MPWIDRVPAVLEAWYPGQEDGSAVANVLFGVVNPSGKLPLTFPKRDRAAATETVEQWPGVVVEGVRRVTYSERQRIGYRWYDAKGEALLFPFGFGLSYTHFAYSDFTATPIEPGGKTQFVVRFTLRNSGNRAGAEVAQLYAGFSDGYAQPPRRLIGFQRVMLSPGEERQVTFIVDPGASNHPLSYWDTNQQAWTLMTGKLTLSLTRSSRDIEAATRIDLPNR